MSYIRVNNVGKAYRQYHSKTGRLIEWLSPLNTKRHNLKWILSDINFEVAPGEAVGIIGINGAGKSTLLKLITGTSRPTTGEIEISGRVAALLELGMGFHSDFTGRQNVYMSGQLLGLSSEKITELMPQIEEFAEIGDYIDQPVRVYSSGM
ncbi:O8 family O-antigen export ABC transporter ATP-binding subunit, partial [Escherichia coli]|nr:O8 family O-antigen export ABC transporter ATP-binding subunit [Escherichia coli]